MIFVSLCLIAIVTFVVWPFGVDIYRRHVRKNYGRERFYYHDNNWRKD